jgi:hypothetical protein
VGAGLLPTTDASRNSQRRQEALEEASAKCRSVLRDLRVTEDHISAHEWSSYHRETIRESNAGGCFYCLEVFPPSEIEDWTDDDDTALCPKCGIDSVIASVCGYPIEREFLKKMHDYWF